jgi:hypothetical protein
VAPQGEIQRVGEALYRVEISRACGQDATAMMTRCHRGRIKHPSSPLTLTAATNPGVSCPPPSTTSPGSAPPQRRHHRRGGARSLGYLGRLVKCSVAPAQGAQPVVEQAATRSPTSMLLPIRWYRQWSRRPRQPPRLSRQPWPPWTTRRRRRQRRKARGERPVRGVREECGDDGVQVSVRRRLLRCAPLLGGKKGIFFRHH